MLARPEGPNEPMLAWKSDTAPRQGRFQLIVMAMAAALPICIFVGVVAYVVADTRRESALVAAKATAAQLADRVSSELTGQQQVLQTLAASTSLDGQQPDLNAFYVEAARAKLAHPLWETIELVDLAGNQIINLLRPVGTALGRTADTESLAQVINTGRPIVGGIGPIGTVSGRRLIAVRVPVLRSDKVKYVLSTLLEPSGVLSLLRYAGAPKDWVGAVVDGRGVVIASTTKDSIEVGQPASRAVLDAVAQSPAGTYSSVTNSGIRVETVYRSLPEVGWTVHFGVSSDTLNSPVSRSLAVLALGGFASLSLAAGLALLTARDLSQRRQEDAQRSQLQLLASEERGQVAVDAAELGTWRWNIETDTLTGSERFKSMLGLTSRERLRLEHLLDVASPDDKLRLDSTIRRSFMDEGSIDTEFQTIGIGRGSRQIRLIGRVRLIGSDLSAYGVVADVTQEHELRAERLLLLRRLAGAQEQERRRISRELHDQVGQTVTGLSLGLKSLERSGNSQPEMLTHIRWLQELTSAIGREIHRAASDLRPTALDDVGLQAALTAYAQEWQQRTSIKILVRHGGSTSHLSEDVAIAAYRLTLEALNNVAKHSKASHVSLLTDARSGKLHLIVEDDGVGFDAALERTIAKSRLGLSGMRERVALVGGELTIETGLGRGTSVFVELPITGRGRP